MNVLRPEQTVRCRLTRRVAASVLINQPGAAAGGKAPNADLANLEKP